MLRRSFASISDDQRIQAVIIAFSFGALLEALAGFGTPVAITAVMLVALGFKPIKAASVALVANTAPVAFGAIAIPIVTLAGLTEIPKEDLGAMVGRQTPLLALFVPLILVGMVDGWRGIKAVWPAAMVGGLAFAIGQFACSNYLSVELTDIVASLLSVGAMVALPARLAARRAADRASDGRAAGPRSPARRPPTPRHEARGPPARRDDGRDSRGDILARLRAVPDHHRRLLAGADRADQGLPRPRPTHEFTWPGLDILNAKGEAPTATTYKFNWLAAAGTLLLISGLLTMAFLRIAPGARARASTGARSTSSSGRR